MCPKIHEIEDDYAYEVENDFESENGQRVVVKVSVGVSENDELPQPQPQAQDDIVFMSARRSKVGKAKVDPNRRDVRVPTPIALAAKRVR